MSIQRARSVEEFVDFVEQAIFEVEELYMAAEYDMESMGATRSFVKELETSLRDLNKAMQDGTYKFANKDLPYMEIVEAQNERLLPFKYLLRQINETHRHGLDIGED